MSKSGLICLHVQKQFKPRSRLPQSNAVITQIQLFPQDRAKFLQLNFGIAHQIHIVFQVCIQNLRNDVYEYFHWLYDSMPEYHNYLHIDSSIFMI